MPKTMRKPREAELERVARMAKEAEEKKEQQEREEKEKEAKKQGTKMDEVKDSIDDNTVCINQEQRNTQEEVTEATKEKEQN